MNMPTSSEDTKLKTTTSYEPCYIGRLMSVGATASLQRRQDCFDDESDQNITSGSRASLTSPEENAVGSVSNYEAKVHAHKSGIEFDIPHTSSLQNIGKVSYGE